jgi:hypothetical protein
MGNTTVRRASYFVARRLDLYWWQGRDQGSTYRLSADALGQELGWRMFIRWAEGRGADVCEVEDGAESSTEEDLGFRSEGWERWKDWGDDFMSYTFVRWG